MKVIFTFIFIVHSYLYAQTPKICGQIIETAGKVDVLKTQNNLDAERIAKAIQAPYEILCTDVVVTQGGSRAKIKLKNGIITLGPNTRIAISRISRVTAAPSVLNLSYGKMRSFLEPSEEKKSKDPHFRVKTSTAVVGVRGTDFYVQFDPNSDVTEQATLKGIVEVQAVNSQEKTEVPAGRKTLVASEEKIKNLASDEVKKDFGIDSKTKVGEESKDKIKVILEPIDDSIVEKIQQTSVLVKNEEVFKSKEALQILGQPENWQPAKDEIPGDLKDIKNVF